MSQALAVMPPTRLGQYEIIRRLGVGGMAEVFLARKRGAEGTYKLQVLKRVLPTHGQSRRFRTMFIAEAQLATRLNHPNIVQVYDFQDIGDDGQLLSMEYVEGSDLGKLMGVGRTQGMRIPPWVAAYIVAEAAKGLHYAHERKDEAGVPLAIVHRDVSPQNILISFDGAVKIADFGIASANLFRDESGVLKGKFGFMSPEQARSDAVDRRSDIYSLGVCLYEMLTGRVLHGSLLGEDLLEAVRHGDVEPPSTFVRDIPEELEAIVLRALAKHREERFQTARDMASAISRAMLIRQELVDASSVEGVVHRLVEREPSLSLLQKTAHEVSLQAPSARGAARPSSSVGQGAGRVTIAAVPYARQASLTAGASVPSADQGVGSFASREVRHVVVVALRLLGMDVLELTLGRAKAEYAANRIKKTLDAIAYKRGTEWGWQGVEAGAVVGLLSNASRAPTEAAWLAVDVHEALAGASEDLPVTIRASMGMVRGVAFGERDKDGRLVRPTLQPPAEILAQHLSCKAPAGGTWVAGGLYRMVRRDFRWNDAPALELSSFLELKNPQKMRICALTRPLTREERLAEMALAPHDLIGREVEKADLHAAYHKAIACQETTQPSTVGPPRAVVRAVIGEMGIGKTSLVAAFLAELPAGTRILRLELTPVRSELPFAACSDLVREAIAVEADQPEAVVTAALEHVLGPFAQTPQGAAMVTLLAEMATGKSFEANDEEDFRYRRRWIAAGVRRLLVALAHRQPLVVVCDGLQWADKASLELISELLRRKDPLPILGVLVTRPEEHVVPYLQGVMRLELRGLSRDDQIRLVEARLGVHEGVASVCAELLPRVAGNPFFLLEMIDALLERGALTLQPTANGASSLVRIEHADEACEALPSTLEQVIGDRLRELPAAERTLVNWLAIAGGPLTLADLSALLGPHEEETMMRLCARGVCDQRGEMIDFRHTIVRDVTYLAIDALERKRMHRCFAEHLGLTSLGRGLSAAIVARHWARGDAPEAAAEFYLEAAHVARTGYQTQLATSYYQRALHLLPNQDVRRLYAHEALEAIYRSLGRHRERKKHLMALRTLAKASKEPRWVAVALARSARLDFDEGHMAHGLTLAQKAAEAAQSAHAPTLEVEAHTLRAELLRELGDVQSALSACDRALAVAEHPDVPPRVRAEVLRTRGVLLRWMGRVSEAVESYAEAIAVFRKHGARRQESHAQHALAYAMFVSERWEDAIFLALSSVSMELAIGGRFQIAKALASAGQCYARLGDLPRALAYLKRARETHARYNDQDSRANTLLISAHVLLEADDHEAAATFYAEASALNAITQSSYDTVHEKIIRALLAYAQGDCSSAVTYASQARKQAEGHALVSFHLYATAIEALCRAELGEMPMAMLLASTAVSAVENIPTEFAMEIRAFGCETLQRSGAISAKEVRARCALHVHRVGERIRDNRLRKLFFERPVVRSILYTSSIDRPLQAASMEPLRITLS